MFWGWICSYSYYYKWQLVLLHVHYFPGDGQVKCHMMVSETWLCWLEDSDRNEMTGSAHWNKEKVWLLRRQKEKKNKIVTIFLNFLRTLISPLSSSQLSLFRRLSFSRAKQTNDRDQTPAEVAVQGEPPPTGSSDPESNRGGAQQRSLPSGARGPRSGACTVLWLQDQNSQVSSVTLKHQTKAWEGSLAELKGSLWRFPVNKHSVLLTKTLSMCPRGCDTWY